MKELKKERERENKTIRSEYLRSRSKVWWCFLILIRRETFDLETQEKWKRNRSVSERGRVKFRNEWNNDSSSFSPWSSSSLSSSSPPPIVRHVPGDRVQDLMKASKIVKFLHAWTDGWDFKIFWVERWGHPAYHLSISIISEERNNNAPTCVVDCLPGQVVTGQASRLSSVNIYLHMGHTSAFRDPTPFFEITSFDVDSRV